VPGRPLDRDDLLELFAELSAELHAEHTVDVIIAGGSFMALRQLRETTEDVDTDGRHVNPSARCCAPSTSAVECHLPNVHDVSQRPPDQVKHA